MQEQIPQTPSAEFANPGKTGAFAQPTSRYVDVNTTFTDRMLRRLLQIKLMTPLNSSPYESRAAFGARRSTLRRLCFRVFFTN